MEHHPINSLELAMAITKNASKQTYYTIRFFVDRDLISDAYRAYGYFRWVDDVIDEDVAAGVVLSEEETAEKMAFVNRQQDILEACYRGEIPGDLCPEEQILVDLVHNDSKEYSGLQTYLRSMMDLMIFDAQRRNRVVSELELTEYTRHLAVAVTEAMHYFIGHNDPSPRVEDRYAAVTAAHITHMLRDAVEDSQAGYYNIPGNYLQKHRLSPQDVESPGYRKWVCKRVPLARDYFRLGCKSLAQIKNFRCRLAGFAYTARFEWMLRTIERENYCLRLEYRQRKSLRAGLWMVGSTLVSFLMSSRMKRSSHRLMPQPVSVEE